MSKERSMIIVSLDTNLFLYIFEEVWTSPIIDNLIFPTYVDRLTLVGPSSWCVFHIFYSVRTYSGKVQQIPCRSVTLPISILKDICDPGVESYLSNVTKLFVWKRHVVKIFWLEKCAWSNAHMIWHYSVHKKCTERYVYWS